MSCESYQQSSLDFGWDEPTRRRAAEVLDHIRSCPACQARLREFDRIADALSSDESTDAIPPGGWAAFERRLAGTAPHHPARPMAWLRPTLAIAASFVLVAGAFTLGRFIPRPDPEPVAVHPVTPASIARDTAAIAPSKVNHEVRAFDQVSKVFDGRASWMLVANGASDVGVAPAALAGESRNVLLLRLTVTRGKQIASDADLLVVPGQTANLTVPLHDSGHSLHYRIGTSAEEPTRLAVWLDINTPQGGQPLAALATNLQVEPGQKVTAGQLATSAGDYELTIGFVRARMPGATP
jgi:hypothetical protein